MDKYMIGEPCTQVVKLCLPWTWTDSVIVVAAAFIISGVGFLVGRIRK
jgi:hypothetical protein